MGFFLKDKKVIKKLYKEIESLESIIDESNSDLVETYERLHLKFLRQLDYLDRFISQDINDPVRNIKSGMINAIMNELSCELVTPSSEYELCRLMSPGEQNIYRAVNKKKYGDELL